MSERKALSEIFNNIQNGVVYGKDREFMGNGEKYEYPFFDKCVYKTVYNNIGWTHFGSSANPMTEKDLLWIITVIFSTTPSKFLAEYIPHTISKYA